MYATRSSCTPLTRLAGRAIITVGIAISLFTTSTAAEATAVFPHQVETHIEWRGPDQWIEFNGPFITDRTRIVTGKVFGQGHVDLVLSAFPGEYFGANPIIGNNTYVSCRVAIDGREILRDAAYKDDGHDCNCLRIMT